AATFHSTIIILLPIVMLTNSKNRFWTALWISMIALILYMAFLSAHVDRMVYGYLTREYHSEGAAVRVAMNTIPAVIFLLFRKKFGLDKNAEKLWTFLSLGILGLIVLLFVLPSSTAVDR